MEEKGKGGQERKGGKENKGDCCKEKEEWKKEEDK